jgi:hypothetical protein
MDHGGPAGRDDGLGGCPGQVVVGDGPHAGLRLDRRSFSTWLAERATPDEHEALFVLRRATSIGLGRLIDLDLAPTAVGARPADESCHTYRSEVVAVALRNHGSARETERDLLGTPIPDGPFASGGGIA